MKIRTTAPRAIGTLSLVAASRVPPAQRPPAPTTCCPLTPLSPKGTVVGAMLTGWEELADPDSVVKPPVRVPALGLSRSGAIGFENSGESPRDPAPAGASDWALEEPLPCWSFPPTRPAGSALRGAEVTDVVGWLVEAGCALGCAVAAEAGLEGPVSWVPDRGTALGAAEGGAAGASRPVVGGPVVGGPVVGVAVVGGCGPVAGLTVCALVVGRGVGGFFAGDSVLFAGGALFFAGATVARVDLSGPGGTVLDGGTAMCGPPMDGAIVDGGIVEGTGAGGRVVTGAVVGGPETETAVEGVVNGAVAIDAEAEGEVRGGKWTAVMAGGGVVVGVVDGGVDGGEVPPRRDGTLVAEDEEEVDGDRAHEHRAHEHWANEDRANEDRVDEDEVGTSPPAGVPPSGSGELSAGCR
jgi:hypothetical protein